MKKLIKCLSLLIVVVLLITMLPLQVFAHTHNWVKDTDSSNKHTVIYKCSDCDATRTVVNHGQIQTVKAKEYYPELTISDNENADLLTCKYCKENNYDAELVGSYYYDTSSWSSDTKYNVLVSQQLINKDTDFIIFKLDTGVLDISSDDDDINKRVNGAIVYIQGEELCLDDYYSDDDEGGNYTDDISKVDTTKPYYTIISYLSFGDTDYTLNVIKSSCNHKYEFIDTVEPTCKTEGYDLYRCAKCNKEIHKNITSKTLHTRGEWKVENKPSCKSEGLETRRCTVCGEVLDSHSIPKTNNHTWNNGIVTTEPSCNTVGIKTYTCSVCGATKTEEIPKKHHFAIEDNKDTDCMLDYKVKVRCVECGLEVNSIVLGHQWVENKILVEPSCNNIGTTEYKCKNCGATKIAYVGKNQHKYVLKYTENDCEHGYNTYVCDGCGDCYIEPHTNGTHQFKRMTNDAYKINYSCSKCGYAKTVPNSRYYTWDNGTVVKKASCTQMGITKYTSIISNKEYTLNVTSDKLPHTYKYEYSNDTEKKICTVCGYSEIVRCKHNYEYVSNNDGTHIVKCSKCGYTDKENCILSDYGYGNYCCEICGYKTYKKPSYTSVTTDIYTVFGYDNGTGGVSEHGVPLDDFGTISVNGAETDIINNYGEFVNKKESENSHWTTVKTEVTSPDACNVEIRFILNHTYRAYRIENIEYSILDKDDDLPLSVKNISQEDLKDNGDGSYSLFLSKDNYSYYGKASIKVSFCCDYINRKCNINFVDEEGRPVYAEINGNKYSVISDNIVAGDFKSVPVKYYTLVDVKSDYPLNKYVKYYNLENKPKYVMSIAEKTNRDLNVTYIYRRNKNTIRIEYIDKETNKKLLPDVDKEVEQGSMMDFSELTSASVDDYSISSIDGDTTLLIQSDRKITVYYTRNKEKPAITKPTSPTSSPKTQTVSKSLPVKNTIDTGDSINYIVIIGIIFVVMLILVLVSINIKRKQEGEHL